MDVHRMLTAGTVGEGQPAGEEELRSSAQMLMYEVRAQADEITNSDGRWWLTMPSPPGATQRLFQIGVKACRQ